jgi:hypothetical protein
MAETDQYVGHAATAEQRARGSLSARIELEYVESPPAGAMYGLDPEEEWVFRLPDRRFVGSSKLLAVNRVTGRVTELEAAE